MLIAVGCRVVFKRSAAFRLRSYPARLSVAHSAGVIGAPLRLSQYQASVGSIGRPPDQETLWRTPFL